MSKDCNLVFLALKRAEDEPRRGPKGLPLLPSLCGALLLAGFIVWLVVIA